MPDYGMPLIGTILKEVGYDVTVYIEHVKAPEWERIAQSDLVCFSSLCAGADKVYQLSSRIRTELHLPVIFGGTHATYFPESSLDHCDYVVLGEGDETIIELVEVLRNGGDPAQSRVSPSGAAAKRSARHLVRVLCNSTLYPTLD